MSVSPVYHPSPALPTFIGLPAESQPAAVRQLANDQLLQRLGAVHAREQVNIVEVLVHIIEAQRRRLYRLAACSSMYGYCLRMMRMSKGEAYRRITAASVGIRFPFILEAIASGSLNLTAVAMLEPHINGSNARELAESASGKPIRALELILAERFPKPARPTIMRVIQSAATNVGVLQSPSAQDPNTKSMQSLGSHPEAIAGCQETVTEFLARGNDPTDLVVSSESMEPLRTRDAAVAAVTDAVSTAATGHQAIEPVPGAAATEPSAIISAAATHIASQIVAQLSATGAPAISPLLLLDATSQALTNVLLAENVNPQYDHTSRADLSPLARDRWCWQFTVDQESQNLLEQAMCFSTAVGTAAAAQEALKNALRCYVAECRKHKFAQVANPRSRADKAHGRHIPAHIQRAVSERDNYQCTFRSADGTRCDEKRALEFDHVRPVAAGGATTLENLRLLCRPHNQLEAERAFGADHVARKIRESRIQARAASSLRKPSGARES